MYQLRIDEGRGTIRSRSWGVWTRETADNYEAEVIRAAVSIRRSYDRVKMLHDAREQVVQPQEVAERFARMPRWIERPEDRLAILVSSSLHKMQVRRLYSDERIQAFLAPDAAETWLYAHSSLRV